MTAKIRHLICLLLSAAVLVCISCSLAEGTEVSTFVHHLSGPLNPSIPLKPVPLTPAEDLKPLPMGIRVKGMPLKLEHISEDFKEYEDSSIHAVVTVDYVEYEDFKGKGYTNCHIVRITVADGSQVRSGISYDDFDGDRLVRARMLAENCNAVAAVNGDFFKSTTTRGYIFRQGSFFRDKANAERDVLLIDSEGDFHVIEKATGKTIEQAMQELPEGVSAVNVFNFGPALVDHGKVTDIASSTTGLAENKDDSFYYQYRNPRVAVVQLGKLEYAIVECDAEKADGHSGMTLQTFADYIYDLFPDALIAYNLDGGNSTNVIFPRSGYGNQGLEVQFYRIHNVPESRSLSDILYFASLEE